MPLDLLRRGGEHAAGGAGAGILAGLIQTVRLIIGAALGDLRLHHPVTHHVGIGTFRRIDRDLVEIRRTQPRFLRVEVREKPTLQQRVIGKVDARHHIRRQESSLLVFGEMVVWIAVQYHPADDA